MNPKTDPEWMLVVEDNPDLWAILKLILPQAFPQLRFVHAADEPQALTYLQGNPAPGPTLPRLILQDFHLPDRATGLRLIEAFKQPGSPYQLVPLVVMSSSREELDSQLVLRVGADSFFAKPAQVEEWLAVLQPLRAYWQVE